MRASLVASAPAFGLLTACSYAPVDERGVEREETLLSVSASGQADATPDEAEFLAGMESFAADARTASQANAAKLADLVTALRASGVREEDIRTDTVSIGRIEYGDRKGQYQASNVVTVTVRDVSAAGEAVTAASEAGANILRGPDLRIADPEAAANSAYTAAYKAARARADAYADAAGMEVARVLYIRDTGGRQGDRYMGGAEPMADAFAPPPPPRPTAPTPEQAAPVNAIMPGRTTSDVSVQVDFALRAK